LTSGRADLVVTLGSDEARQLQNDPRADARVTLSERASMFRLTTLTGPTQDIRLRQAIRFAINRQLIADALLGGYDHVVNAVGTPVSFGYIDGIDPPRFDPDAARRLIREIGAPAQQELTLLTSPVFDQRIVQAIHQMLLDVGLHVNIVSIDLGTFLRRSTGDPAQQGDFSFFRWSCACQDLDGTLEPLFHS